MKYRLIAALTATMLLSACSDNNSPEEAVPPMPADQPVVTDPVVSDVAADDVGFTLVGSSITLTTGDSYQIQQRFEGLLQVMFEGEGIRTLELTDGVFVVSNLSKGIQTEVTIGNGFVGPAPSPLDADAILFTTDDWRLTARLSDDAMNMAEISNVRQFVGRIFPAGTLTAGVTDSECDDGSARAEVSEDMTVFTFVNCHQGGLTMSGQYTVVGGDERTGNVVKSKLDEDFLSLTLFDDEGLFRLFLQGDSKHQIATTDADDCGFVKIENVLRQDFVEASTFRWKATNLAREDIVTTARLDDGGEGRCGLQISTLAASGSAAVEVRLENSVQTNRVNRNGKLIQRLDDKTFINAEDFGSDAESGSRNVTLSIYNAESDSALTVYRTSLTDVQVTVDPAQGEQITLKAPFAGTYELRFDCVFCQ